VPLLFFSFAGNLYEIFNLILYSVFEMERPANKSQVEISDFLGRQKGNTKSSR